MSAQSPHINVKICGLTRPSDVEAALLFGADYLGFIIEAVSSRRLSVAQARALVSPLAGIVPGVAVTVDPSFELVEKIADIPGLDYIQIHGADISLDFIHKIKSKTGLGVIRSLAIRGARDLVQINPLIGVADMILLDAPAPKGAEQQGGHGLSFDWNQIDWRTLRRLQSWQIPIGLAGGLTPSNVAKAKALTGLSFFDVSSGVEALPGVKDSQAIEAFILRARGGRV